VTDWCVDIDGIVDQNC